MPDDIQTTEITPVVRTEIGGLLALAIEKDLDVDKLERLVALKEREDERSSVAAFNGAMADLHGSMGSVVKNQKATIKTRDGRTMTYRYADKHAIAEAIRNAGAAALGLSWSWDYKDTDAGIEATCWAKHRDGHRESSTWSSVKDGRDNPLTSNTQKKKILTTTAERITLASVFGITDTEDDLDSPAMDAPTSTATITEAQGLELEAKVNEAGADWDRFLKAFGVERLRDFPAAQFGQALGLLNRKIKAKSKAKGQA